MKKKCNVKIGKKNIIKMNVPRFAGHPDIGIGGGYCVFTTNEFINWSLTNRKIKKSEKIKFKKIL